MKKYTIEIEISDAQESMLEQIVKLDRENLEKLGVDVNDYLTKAEMLEVIIRRSTTGLLETKILELVERARSFDSLPKIKKGAYKSPARLKHPRNLSI